MLYAVADADALTVTSERLKRSHNEVKSSVDRMVAVNAQVHHAHHSLSVCQSVL
jgi:hypothetical protein